MTPGQCRQGGTNSNAARVDQSKLGHPVCHGTVPPQFQFFTRRRIGRSIRRPAVDGNVGSVQQAGEWRAGGPSSWGGEQVKVLETLLGKDFLDRLFSMSSQDVLQFLHSELSGAGLGIG